MQIHIPYHASPTPEITWARAGTDISMDSRVTQETSDYMTQLQFSKCQLSDSGVYTVTLTNSMGTDSSNVRLRVVDRPSPPEGPLLITDITPDSCCLTWKSPKEDGGSPVTNYIIERCHLRSGQEPRWERVTSFVRTTRYEVHGLQENEQYKFRVRAENQYGVSDPLENTEPIVAKYQFNVPGQPGAPEPTDMDTTWVQLKWDPPSSDGGSKILGYMIEFREPTSAKWIQASPHLTMDPKGKVESLRDRGEYEFRVIAKNAAGFGRPSESSGVIKLKPKFGPPGPPGAPHADAIGRNHVTLTWSPPVDDGGSKITGYICEKREVGDPIWVRCSDYNVRDPEFTVPNLIHMREYEFRVVRSRFSPFHL